MADFYFANNQQVTTNTLEPFVLMVTMEDITECCGRKLVVGEEKVYARERKPAGVAFKLSFTKEGY